MKRLLTIVGLVSIGLLLSAQITNPTFSGNTLISGPGLFDGGVTIQGTLVVDGGLSAYEFYYSDGGRPLAIGEFKTTGALTYYVAEDGTPANDCLSVSTPCRHPQEVISRLPRFLDFPVTISIDGGVYDGGINFNNINSRADITAITMMGQFKNLAVLTGTATGTTSAVSHTAVPLPTFTDSTQTWTVNDLRGHFFRFSSGGSSGQRCIIQSNTATVVTCATPVFTGTPVAGDTYVIETPAAVVVSTSSAVPAIQLNGTLVNANIQNISFEDNASSGSSTGCQFTNPGSVLLQRSRCVATSSNLGAGMRGPGSNGLGGFLSLITVYAGATTGGNVATGLAIVRIRGLSISGSYFLGNTPNAATTIDTLGWSYTSSGGFTSENLSGGTGSAINIWRSGEAGQYSGNSLSPLITAICQPGSSGIGLGYGEAATSGSTAFFAPLCDGTIPGLYVKNCATGLFLNPHSTARFLGATNLTFDTVTTAFSTSKGSAIDLNGFTPSFSGVTNEIQLDGVNYTYSFLNSLNPGVISNSYGTAVMK